MEKDRHVRGTKIMNLSLKQYRAIDLGLMLFIVAAAEALIAHAARFWFPEEIYVLSPTLAMVCIVMMRWGRYAVLHAVGGSLAMCIALGAEPKQYAVYCIGTCLSLTALLFFRKLKKSEVRNSPKLTLLFALTAYITAQLGRWLVGLLMGGSPKDIVQLFATDSLTLLFTLVAVHLARKIDGLFEDQIDYLVRTQAERQKSGMPDQGDTEYGESTGSF